MAEVVGRSAMREAGASSPRYNEVDGIMPGEVSTAQGTLKRLMEAENQAREILRAAEEGAKERSAMPKNKPSNKSRPFIGKWKTSCAPA